LKSSWDLRIKRAGELAEQHSSASELLKFYQHLARFQKSVHEKLASLEDHDVSVLLSFLPGLISTVKEHGSPQLRLSADALAEASNEELLELLNSIWLHQVESADLHPEYAFFARALLQPFAEYLAEKTRPLQQEEQEQAQEQEQSTAVCPFCGSIPQVAVLRPEGDGGKRSLVCSLCSTEWTFRRQKCPHCGEEHKDKLPVFVAQDFNNARVDACDSCNTYIKAIDMTKDGRAVPVVDELATVSLDLWAQEKNYHKRVPNLFGV
jgi:FdhE protein